MGAHKGRCGRLKGELTITHVFDGTHVDVCKLEFDGDDTPLRITPKDEQKYAEFIEGALTNREWLDSEV